ncbi:hypothetical protein ADUPG1_007656 [Aduncisulcus paluster]|uniref:Protein kinase domain-containing protein n=1 Tax=Aduncisulcus paluster TaxID=2918883 RepID=A0ABQ5KP36_9EUKA|nr:hypothetical protein ADUPG1_007656 [Aduncisulcus paluster]
MVCCVGTHKDHEKIKETLEDLTGIFPGFQSLIDSLLQKKWDLTQIPSGDVSVIMQRPTIYNAHAIHSFNAEYGYITEFQQYFPAEKQDHHLVTQIMAPIEIWSSHITEKSFIHMFAKTKHFDFLRGRHNGMVGSEMPFYDQDINHLVPMPAPFPHPSTFLPKYPYFSMFEEVKIPNAKEEGLDHLGLVLIPEQCTMYRNRRYAICGSPLEEVPYSELIHTDYAALDQVFSTHSRSVAYGSIRECLLGILSANWDHLQYINEYIAFSMDGDQSPCPKRPSCPFPFFYILPPLFMPVSHECLKKSKVLKQEHLICFLSVLFKMFKVRMARMMAEADPYWDGSGIGKMDGITGLMWNDTKRRILKKRKGITDIFKVTDISLEDLGFLWLLKHRPIKTATQKSEKSQPSRFISEDYAVQSHTFSENGVPKGLKFYLTPVYFPYFESHQDIVEMWSCAMCFYSRLCADILAVNDLLNEVHVQPYPSRRSFQPSPLIININEDTKRMPRQSYFPSVEIAVFSILYPLDEVNYRFYAEVDVADQASMKIREKRMWDNLYEPLILTKGSFPLDPGEESEEPVIAEVDYEAVSHDIFLSCTDYYTRCWTRYCDKEIPHLEKVPEEPQMGYIKKHCNGLKEAKREAERKSNERFRDGIISDLEECYAVAEGRETIPTICPVPLVSIPGGAYLVECIEYILKKSIIEYPQDSERRIDEHRKRLQAIIDDPNKLFRFLHHFSHKFCFVGTGHSLMTALFHSPDALTILAYSLKYGHYSFECLSTQVIIYLIHKCNFDHVDSVRVSRNLDSESHIGSVDANSVKKRTILSINPELTSSIYDQSPPAPQSSKQAQVLSGASELMKSYSLNEIRTWIKSPLYERASVLCDIQLEWKKAKFTLGGILHDKRWTEVLKCWDFRKNPEISLAYPDSKVSLSTDERKLFRKQNKIPSFEIVAYRTKPSTKIKENEKAFQFLCEFSDLFTSPSPVKEFMDSLRLVSPDVLERIPLIAYYSSNLPKILTRLFRCHIVRGWTLGDAKPLHDMWIEKLSENNLVRIAMESSSDKALFVDRIVGYFHSLLFQQSKLPKVILPSNISASECGMDSNGLFVQGTGTDIRNVCLKDSSKSSFFNAEFWEVFVNVFWISAFFSHDCRFPIQALWQMSCLHSRIREGVLRQSFDSKAEIPKNLRSKITDLPHLFLSTLTFSNPTRLILGKGMELASEDEYPQNFYQLSRLLCQPPTVKSNKISSLREFVQRLQKFDSISHLHTGIFMQISPNLPRYQLVRCFYDLESQDTIIRGIGQRIQRSSTFNSSVRDIVNSLLSLSGNTQSTANDPGLMSVLFDFYHSDPSKVGPLPSISPGDYLFVTQTIAKNMLEISVLLSILFYLIIMLNDTMPVIGIKKPSFSKDKKEKKDVKFYSFDEERKGVTWDEDDASTHKLSVLSLCVMFRYCCVNDICIQDAEMDDFHLFVILDRIQANPIPAKKKKEVNYISLKLDMNNIEGRVESAKIQRLYRYSQKYDSISTKKSGSGAIKYPTEFNDKDGKYVNTMFKLIVSLKKLLSKDDNIGYVIFLTKNKLNHFAALGLIKGFDEIPMVINRLSLRNNPNLFKYSQDGGILSRSSCLIAPYILYQRLTRGKKDLVDFRECGISAYAYPSIILRSLETQRQAVGTRIFQNFENLDKIEQFEGEKVQTKVSEVDFLALIRSPLERVSSFSQAGSVSLSGLFKRFDDSVSNFYKLSTFSTSDTNLDHAIQYRSIIKIRQYFACLIEQKKSPFPTLDICLQNILLALSCAVKAMCRDSICPQTEFRKFFYHKARKFAVLIHFISELVGYLQLCSLLILHEERGKDPSSLPDISNFSYCFTNEYSSVWYFEHLIHFLHVDDISEPIPKKRYLLILEPIYAVLESIYILFENCRHMVPHISLSSSFYTPLLSCFFTGSRRKRPRGGITSQSKTHSLQPLCDSVIKHITLSNLSLLDKSAYETFVTLLRPADGDGDSSLDKRFLGGYGIWGPLPELPDRDDSVWMFAPNIRSVTFEHSCHFQQFWDIFHESTKKKGFTQMSSLKIGSVTVVGIHLPQQDEKLFPYAMGEQISSLTKLLEYINVDELILMGDDVFINEEEMVVESDLYVSKWRNILISGSEYDEYKEYPSEMKLSKYCMEYINVGPTESESKDQRFSVTLNGHNGMPFYPSKSFKIADKNVITELRRNFDHFLESLRKPMNTIMFLGVGCDLTYPGVQAVVNRYKKEKGLGNFVAEDEWRGVILRELHYSDGPLEITRIIRIFQRFLKTLQNMFHSGNMTLEQIGEKLDRFFKCMYFISSKSEHSFSYSSYDISKHCENIKLLIAIFEMFDYLGMQLKSEEYISLLDKPEFISAYLNSAREAHAWLSTIECEEKIKKSTYMHKVLLERFEERIEKFLSFFPGSLHDSGSETPSEESDGKDGKNSQRKKNVSNVIKHDSFTLTSSSSITPHCIIGHGGFSEVLLVEVEGIPIPCVLKKMLRKADEKVVKTCRKEFKVQRKLFNNPKCFNRIPRPLYILDLLVADLKGEYGFLMEFCIGGSVSSFAKKWCIQDGEEEEEECSSSEEDSDDHKHFDPMTLNPVKVSALCVGMIECLDDVFTAKPKLTHRDIKPDNFLVRVDPKHRECTVVLSDLGLAQILDSISSSTTTKSGLIQPIEFEKKEKKETSKQKASICGTLVYNSYETFLAGTQTQKSDGYSLGMSILALFICEHPFVSLPNFREVVREPIEDRIDLKIIGILMVLMEKNLAPKLSQSPLFRSLKTIEGGKFQPVHECLNEVFTGLTQIDVDKRMSVHEAREKVQSIKHLLPEIGEGWKCPSIDDIVKTQLVNEEGKGDGSQGSKDLGTKYWSIFISMLSTVPSLVPHISPKYDADMVWCKNNGGWSEDYIRYLVNCYPSLKKWLELVESINKCPDSESTSKLYHEHRDSFCLPFIPIKE